MSIEHRIAIAAPADAVWRVVADLEGWGSWSKLYASAAGTLAVGETIDVSIVLPGLKPQAARATIVEATPGVALRYRTRPMRGLVIGDRYMRIERTGPNSCVMINGEHLGGLLGPLLARMIGPKVSEGVRLMNEALKAKVEGNRRSS